MSNIGLISMKQYECLLALYALRFGNKAYIILRV